MCIEKAVMQNYFLPSRVHATPRLCVVTRSGGSAGHSWQATSTRVQTREGYQRGPTKAQHRPGDEYFTHKAIIVVTEVVVFVTVCHTSNLLCSFHPSGKSHGLKQSSTREPGANNPFTVSHRYVIFVSSRGWKY